MRDGWNIHKIDSLLRGNWATELVARQTSTDLPVLLVPAWPDLQRVCVDGVVFAQGVPVSEGPAGTDPRSPVRTSRPIAHLLAAGADHVVSAKGAQDLEAAYLGSAQYIVCDASEETDVAAIASWWARRASDVLLAGPAGPLGRAIRAVATGDSRPAGTPDFGNRWLIVCGSLHPMARRQLAALSHRFPDVPILSTAQLDPGTLVAPVDAQRAAWQLAQDGQAEAVRLQTTTVVVIGGDTAAAVIGDRPWTVWGTAGPGLPYGRAEDGNGPWVITKAGGFGNESQLADLYATFGAGT